MSLGSAAWGEAAWGEAGEVVAAPPPSGVALLTGHDAIFEQGIILAGGQGIATLVGHGMLYEQDFLQVTAFADDQWDQGTIDLTQGSATVVGVGTEFHNLSVGDLLIVPRSAVSMVVYRITAIASDSQLTLSAPWPVASLEGAPYIVHRRLDVRGLPLLERGDECLAQLMTYCLIQIDQLLGAP